MVDVPSALMVAPSAASLCCVAATGERRRVRSWLSGTVMLAAMLIAVVPGIPGPFVLIAATCLFASIFPIHARSRAAVSVSPMQVHRALSATLMSALLVLLLAARTSEGLEARPTRDTEVMANMPGMNMTAEPVLHMAFGGMIAVGAYLAFSIWVIARRVTGGRAQRIAGGVEAALMTVSVIAMVTML